MADSSSGGVRSIISSVNLSLYNSTPELLDRQTLLFALESRYINVPNMNLMSKEQLLEIYVRIIPLSQRTKHKQGKSKAQKYEAKDALYSSNCISIGFSKTTTPPHLSHATSDKTQNVVGERLKPPPDVINYERKKITLNRSSSSKSNCSDDLDKIVIIDRTKRERKLNEIVEIECPETKRQKVGIIEERKACERVATVSVSEKSSTCSKDNIAQQPAKRVKLKRTSYSSQQEAAENESTVDLDNERLKGIQSQ